ncbi:hypothetical protein FHS18_002121 [Paenibacillus phyllosphaerae]|uniref:DUF2087 domain-containing protein n=1 Tax=Paenibacillus phyllosphaerae TaxID=274593 RepID=A0A7W5FMJ1_9BACL|nr:DUF2087 domain-containing protein [Paenibacillus phyllosphaerae]MBB3110054.1 hypothetical protein [Paenibacillus phyllosphaerae]
MEINELFWSAELADLKLGYAYEAQTESYRCLICGESFEDGVVYRVPGLEDRLYEARKFAGYHVSSTHGSVLSYLLSLDKKATGLTDLQKELIRDFAAGLSDAEIVKKAGSGSASTIRNHRFVMKEKAKQAKLMLAIMDLMDRGASVDAPRFLPIHRTATQVDERYAITEDENAALMEQYFPDGPQGRLASFPRKEKRKIVILRHIASFFAVGQEYSEKEINERLKVFWEEDYVTLRRYLIEYGYLDRTDDGSRYWLKV